MKILYIGELKFSIKYKKEEAPQLAGGGHKEIEEGDYVYVIFNQYFVYNKETDEINFSPDANMTK